MNGLFSSQDSKFTLKTAFLVTCVPILMIGIIIYSVWLMLIMNFSYFRSNGFPFEGGDLQEFTDYLLQSQIEYIPYVALFVVGVFFIGLFLAHITLRPFHQLVEMCQVIKEAKGEKVRIVGLGNKKLLIKMGQFLCNYAEARKNQKSIPIPEELERLKSPAVDGVFYFQFFCILVILMGIAISSIYIFTTQLQDEILRAAVSMLKAPKGMATFLGSQSIVFEVIVIIPSAVSFVIYCFIARMIISRVQGVTYAYIRDICDVARGNTMRRLNPRDEDPGKDAAVAINEILDKLHPKTVKVVTDNENVSALSTQSN
jgi:hypothetical protein